MVWSYFYDLFRFSIELNGTDKPQNRADSSDLFREDTKDVQEARYNTATPPITGRYEIVFKEAV